YLSRWRDSTRALFRREATAYGLSSTSAALLLSRLGTAPGENRAVLQRLTMGYPHRWNRVDNCAYRLSPTVRRWTLWRRSTQAHPVRCDMATDRNRGAT